MAMTTTGMKTVIKAQVRIAMAAKGFDIDHPDTNGEADDYIDALAEGIANGVVVYIQLNAQVVDPGGTSPGNWPIL